MKKIALSFGIAALLFVAIGSASAQIVITNGSVTGGEFIYTQNFDSITTGQIVGNPIVLPTGWTASGVAAAVTYRGTSTGGTTGGAYAYNSETLGYLGSGSATALTYSLTIQNSSSFTFDNFDLSYLAETWRAAASRLSNWTVSYSINGGAAVALSALTYTVNGTTTITPPATLSVSNQAFTFASGDSLVISFLGDRGATGSGSSSGISIDDISFTATAVPEPSTYAMLIAGAGVMFWTLRRKRA